MRDCQVSFEIHRATPRVLERFHHINIPVTLPVTFKVPVDPPPLLFSIYTRIRPDAVITNLQIRSYCGRRRFLYLQYLMWSSCLTTPGSITEHAFSSSKNLRQTARPFIDTFVTSSVQHTSRVQKNIAFKCHLKFFKEELQKFLPIHFFHYFLFFLPRYLLK